MKNILLVLLVFYKLILQSQTVNQAFNEPSIGDVDKNYKLDTSAYTTGLPTATGTNVVWDFTKVFGAFPVFFDSVVAPSSAAGNASFPLATYAQKRGGINSFFRSAPGQTEWVGVYSPSLTVTFTNTAIIATYPISYGYNSTDPVVGTFQYGNNTGVCNGSLNITANGVGTLQLPDNVTFQNVLRLRSVSELTMTTGAFPVGKIRQSIVSYYVTSKKYPVLTVQYQTYELIVGTPTITATAYGNFDYFTVAGLENSSLHQGIDIYPNPFHDVLHLKNLSMVDLKGLTIHDLHGRELLRSTSAEILDLKELPPGVYFLEITTKEGSSYRKIIKE